MLGYKWVLFVWDSGSFGCWGISGTFLGMPLLTSALASTSCVYAGVVLLQVVSLALTLFAFQTKV